MNYSYKDLQTALKNLRSDGFDVQVKLNAKQDVLQAEYDRLMTIPEPLQQLEPITADDFNEMVGFPTTALVTANAVLETPEDLETNMPSEASETLEAIQPMALTNMYREPTEAIWNSSKVPDSKGFSHPTGNQETFQQPETISDKTLERFQITSEQFYWIDGTELGDRLEATQTQAIRNIEDGWRALLRLGKNLQAFKTGFDDGLRLAEAKKTAKAAVSALKPPKMPEKVIQLPKTKKRPRAA